jgi:ferredoxin
VRIVVDPELCEANAVCVALAPELFELPDGGTARVRIPLPPEELRGLAEDAAAGCPRAAIRIDDA